MSAGNYVVSDFDIKELPPENNRSKEFEPFNEFVKQILNSKKDIPNWECVKVIFRQEWNDS